MKAPVGLLSQVKKLAQHSNSIFAICHSTICHSRYNDGQAMWEIRDRLNEKGIKNLVGSAFTYTSTTTIVFKQKQEWLRLRFVSSVKPPLHGTAFYSCGVALGRHGPGRGGTLTVHRRPGEDLQGRNAHRRPSDQRRSPKDRDIAMVFQSYALEHHMTVYREPPAGKPPAVLCVWGMKCRMLQARFVFHGLLSVRVIL